MKQMKIKENHINKENVQKIVTNNYHTNTIKKQTKNKAKRTPKRRRRKGKNHK